MLPFLKAPADAPLMTDKHEIDARYRYWRRHILLTIWLGYALFYFTRKSFNSAVPEILANGVLSRSDIGLLATLFYITYGVSKFVSGIVSDRSNARYFMGIGLIATGIINILFGFSTSLWAFAVLWVLNAFFQGWGSPVCARLLTAWYSRTERGGWWALWNTAHNVGGALIPIVMAASALHYGWRAGMMIAGCMAIVVGIFLCWRLRDRPQALGLPAVGEWRHDALEIAQQQEGAGLTRKEILTKYVLLNPYIWLLSFCYVLVYVVRAAINDWGNLYMSETLGVDLVTANTAVTMFELGGFIGALVAGWGSDKLFNGNRGPCRQEMVNVPPSAVTRSRIPVRPKPCCPESGGKPLPSSSITSINRSSCCQPCSVTALASACFTMLFNPSWQTRNSVTRWFSLNADSSIRHSR